MNEHDQVISFITKDLSEKYKVLPNSSVNKNWHVEGLFPDIIVKSRENSEVLFIIEVETSDTVASTTSVSQWKNYAKLPGTHYIIVPKDKLNQAKSLATAIGIKAVKFGFYRIINNEVKVTYEP